MENKLLEDIENWATEMANRLEESKEGGFIVMATDNQRIISASGATKGQMKKMLGEMLKDKRYQEIMLETIEEEQTPVNVVNYGCKKSAESN